MRLTELAAAAEDDLGELHLALDRGARAGLERADRRQVRAVLVAQRQQEQQVLGAPHPETLEARGERGADPAQRGDRAWRDIAGRRAGPAVRAGTHARGRYNMHSISIGAPRGSCATPTVERAG